MVVLGTHYMFYTFWLHDPQIQVLIRSCEFLTDAVDLERGDENELVKKLRKENDALKRENADLQRRVDAYEGSLLKSIIRV